MSRSVPPAAARLARAHAAGYRTRAPGIAAAASGLALVAGVAIVGPAAWADTWSVAFERSIASRAATWSALEPGVSLGLRTLGLLALALACASPLAAWLGRRLGRRVPDPGVLVSPSATRSPAVWTVVLMAGGTLAYAIAVVPVHAGAARAAAASEVGLSELWWTWAGSVLLTATLLAAAIGVVQQRVSAHRLWRALHRTPDEVRREARRAG